MALLQNGIETLELGVTAWREIINYNFEKLLTKDEILALINGEDVSQGLSGYITQSKADSRYLLKDELEMPSTDNLVSNDDLELYYKKMEAKNDFYTKDYIDDNLATTSQIAELNEQIQRLKNALASGGGGSASGGDGFSARVF